jgi:DNA-directed RNA polymerase specialized sigma subunit
MKALAEDLSLTTGDIEDKRLKAAIEGVKSKEAEVRVAASQKTAKNASKVDLFESLPESEQEILLSRFKESDHLKKINKNIASSIKKVEEGRFWVNPKYALLKSAFIEFLTETL